MKIYNKYGICFLILIAMAAIASAKPLTERMIRFNLNQMPNGPKPTVERLSDELTILVASLFKRRELDEVNQRSLIRIRAYLADIYRKPSTTAKLKRRALTAIRQITAELQNRLDFDARYKAGLVAPIQAISQNRQGQSRGPLDKGMQPARLNPDDQMSAVPVYNARKRFNQVPVQQVTRRQVRPVMSSASPARPQPGNFYNVRENRGRRLQNLISSGLLSERDLNVADKERLNLYRNMQSEGRAQPVRTPQPQLSASRVRPVVPPKPQSLRSKGPLPSTPMPPRFPENFRSAPPSTTQRSFTNGSRQEKFQQPVRADRILRSLDTQIQKRIDAGQIDLNKKDPKDYRDQIEGASDEEWESY